MKSRQIGKVKLGAAMRRPRAILDLVVSIFGDPWDGFSIR